MTLGYDVFDVNDVIGESFLNSYPNLYPTQHFFDAIEHDLRMT